MATLSKHSLYHWRANLAVYGDRRVLSIFLLGIAQGLPWTIIGSMLTLWLKESGISRTEIGHAALIFSVYAINFLWSPIIDLSSPPYLRKIGRRKSWIVLCQIVIALICFVISAQDPGSSAEEVVFLCLLIALCSATQDIAIDAYRVDSFGSGEAQKISAASGAITAGWWTGYAGVGALPLMLSDIGWSWPQLYLLLGCTILSLALMSALLPDSKYSNPTFKNQAFNHYRELVGRIKRTTKISLCVLILSGIITTALLALGNTQLDSRVGVMLLFFVGLSCGVMLFKIDNTEPNGQYQPSFADTGLAWALSAIVAPLKDFFSNNGNRFAILFLLFIVLFKLGEAFLGRMSIVFYKEIGFSNTQIATYSKLLTWWLTVIFALLGGIVNSKFGLFKGLLVSGIAMAGTNLMFSVIALVGPVEKLYALTIIFDGFAAAWSTVAFVAFISHLCNHAFSATQYALLASLSNFGKTTLSSTSGQVVDYLNGNWALFFALTAIMVVPSLVILWQLKSRFKDLIPHKNTESS